MLYPEITTAQLPEQCHDCPTIKRLAGKAYNEFCVNVDAAHNYKDHGSVPLSRDGYPTISALEAKVASYDEFEAKQQLIETVDKAVEGYCTGSTRQPILGVKIGKKVCQNTNLQMDSL